MHVKSSLDPRFGAKKQKHSFGSIIRKKLKFKKYFIWKQGIISVVKDAFLKRYLSFQ